MLVASNSDCFSFFLVRYNLYFIFVFLALFLLPNSTETETLGSLTWALPG